MVTHKVVIRPAAAGDLEAIATYTKQQWGVRQAKRYVAALRIDIESLASFPTRHALYRSSDGHEFRKLSSGHHLVFYTIDERTVQVIRVLHERMDVDRHL
ncbi:toxin ParE1 [Blastomonas aquatica]|uniref:Toxin n=2 Tax=Blastomonas aquatica TaxID=1510276 RepID=A0ABQ1ISV7_9SPHN|nr:type II toxin-antitoxin system RelE/ParE family toxin [Blastomonas aquatica]GGB49775.1 toxin ParE1 [Blastomonas aquatica]